MEAVNAFISMCFKDNHPMVIKPTLNEKYKIGEKDYKFTEEVLQRIIESKKVKVTYDGEKQVNIQGIEGMWE